MKIKMNRGPMKGQLREVSEGTTELVVQGIDKPIRGTDDYLDFSFQVKQGSYRRSNVVLKSGVVVFEWMGWYQR